MGQAKRRRSSSIPPTTSSDTARHARRLVTPRKRSANLTRNDEPDPQNRPRHDTTNLIPALYIFALAAFLGYLVISRVPPLLHTPLMSATNAISGISLVGSIVVAGAQ